MKRESLGALLPLALVEPDGLLVTTGGRYVRVLECERTPNPLSASPEALIRIERALADVARRIPDRQALCAYANNDPLPLEEAMEPDQRHTAQAARRDRHHANEQLAQCRERLLAATTQTVLQAASAEQPAVAARWWVAVPYRPPGGPPREQLRALRAQARGRTLWRAHREAALESLRVTEQIDEALTAAGLDTYPLDGVQALAILWERLHPAARVLPDLEQLATACTLPYATTLGQAAHVRHEILSAVCAGAECGIDAAEDPAYVRHADGTLEEIIHLGTPPQHTTQAWLQHLTACPLPLTLAVRIEVGARESVRRRQRMRWKRLRAAVRYKERRDRLVGSDEQDALEEAQLLDQELASEVGASVYRVGIYCSLRDPRGDVEEFQRIVRATCQQFHALTNARVIRGRWLNLPGFTATLPAGEDPLKARRRYAQRNIAHCVPLTSSGGGCPTGLIVGTADPGGTLQRLHPFDPLFPTSVTLTAGRGGGGKTVTTNLLCGRFISQGGRVYVTDRSSTPDERGDSSGSGHYDMLLALVPGAKRVQVGTAHGAVICPWDVPDIQHVPDQKIEFLLALHALLIGHARDADGLVRTLDADEETLLREAIGHVYAQCARGDAQRPREQLLIDALTARQAAGELQGANADKLQSLLLRLGPYGQAGALAHIADSQTTVPSDAPMVLFDFTGLSERLAPALTLAIADWVEWQVHRLRRARVAGELDDSGEWAGRCMLVIEEGWKPLASPAAGSWLNEYARRARHYALWLDFVTQFFRDFDSEQGRAMLSNQSVVLCVANERSDLEYARQALELTDTDIDEIVSLPSQKGAYATVYMISARGRVAIRVAPGDLEYWIASSNPDHDQPRRAAAISDAAGEPWEALELLCDPAWHEQYRQRNEAA